MDRFYELTGGRAFPSGYGERGMFIIDYAAIEVMRALIMRGETNRDTIICLAFDYAEKFLLERTTRLKKFNAEARTPEIK